MRVASNTLGGTFNDEITVIRGALATRKTDHENGSIIKKIKTVPLEIRRPTTMRASGHTFEYLGYGPGNYSTGLPQVQIRSLDETEEFLAQAQEKKGAIVVYTGMNNRGDSFQGNSKTTASSGEIVTYDIPTPTITGESASRLSAVFDEIIVKERIVIEGGASQSVLSQFDGPINLNSEVNFTAPVNARNIFNVRDETESDNITSGSLIVSGGVGIAKNLNVGGNVNFSNELSVTGPATFNGSLYAAGGYVGAAATFGNIRIAVADDNTIDTTTGKLVLDSSSGLTEVNDNLRVVGITTLAGSIYLGDASTDALVVAANSEFNGTVDVDADFAVRSETTDKFTVASSTGNTVIKGTLKVETSATVDNIFLDGNTITTSTGNLTLDSNTGTVAINDNVTVAGTLSVNGNVTLGNESTDITTVNGDLRVTGDITAFYSSDRRLKDNINPIAEALAKVNSISGNTYTWNESSNKEGNDVGVIAQEVLEVLPEAVVTRDNGYLAVDYQKIVPLLVESIKELSAKVEKLEQKLQDK